MAAHCGNQGGFSTFTVGVAGKNQFHDWHVSGLGVSVLDAVGKSTCSLVCSQTYSCGGNVIGTHTITRTLTKSVISSTNVSVITITKN